MNLAEKWTPAPGSDAEDAWAYEREWELREQAYRRYREGLIGPIQRATESIRALGIAIGGAK